jgi:hypothetical protein
LYSGRREEPRLLSIRLNFWFVHSSIVFEVPYFLELVVDREVNHGRSSFVHYSFDGTDFFELFSAGSEHVDSYTRPIHS